MRRPVRINDLHLSKGFLNQDEKKQKEILCNIMEQSFNVMKTTANLDQKAEVTTGLLERSIVVLESEEEYEECQILKQLLEVIPEVVENIKRKGV